MSDCPWERRTLRATNAGETEPPRARGGYRPWAKLLKHAFGIDVLECPKGFRPRTQRGDRPRNGATCRRKGARLAHEPRRGCEEASSARQTTRGTYTVGPCRLSNLPRSPLTDRCFAAPRRIAWPPVNTPRLGSSRAVRRLPTGSHMRWLGSGLRKRSVVVGVFFPGPTQLAREVSRFGCTHEEARLVLQAGRR